MPTPLSEENSCAEQPRRKKRWFRYILWSLLCFVLLLCAGTVILTASLFSSPQKIPLKPLTIEDMVLQQKLIRRISREVFQSRERKKESRLILKASELQSLFRLIDYGFSAAKLAGKYEGLEPRYLEPVFGPGRIRAVYPLNTGHSWLFGGVLRWQITATPELDDKTLTIVLHDCRIGIIPLPLSIAEKILHKILVQVHRSREFSRFCKIIKKMSLQKDGSLAVIYEPQKLLTLLTF